VDVIDALAHPERHGGDERDAFTVIVPSLPGFGFSPSPRRPLTAPQLAGLWHQLMVRRVSRLDPIDTRRPATDLDGPPADQRDAVLAEWHQRCQLALEAGERYVSDLRGFFAAHAR